MERKSKAKTHKGDLEVTATVPCPDGTTFTICGCSVEEVRAAVEECKAPAEPPTGGGEQPDIQAGG